MPERKSFIMHKDSLAILDDLSDEMAGKLFKAIKTYQYGEEPGLDALTKIAFLPFRNQFIRDDEKYQKTCKRRAEAGSKGGKAKASKSKQMLASASKSKQDLANLADSDSKSKSKSDSKSDSKKTMSSKADLFTDEQFEEMWKDYPKRKGGIGGKEPVRRSIKKLIGKGYTFEQLHDSVKRYCEFMTKEGKVGTEFVMLVSSFFGDQKAGYDQDWSGGGIQPAPQQAQVPNLKLL